MSSNAVIPDHPSDFLARTQFLGSLQNHIDGIAAVPLSELPTPRVLAVDAKWGAGKSWVAERIRSNLEDESQGYKVASIDAFRYDHHSDAFAVIAAAIYKTLAPDGEQRSSFLRATGQVARKVLPLFVKGATHFALKQVGLEGELGDVLQSVRDEVADGASDFSEVAIDHMLKAYANTELVQDNFLRMLNALTADLDKPLVVLLDELDRCRPSFALEVLERIKHLFAAENVVFVLFWNSAAIAESVRHTYGRDIEAELYLSKFVALTLRLPEPMRAPSRGASTFARFIEKEVSRTFPDAVHGRDLFQDGLINAAAVMDPSLRDLQRAIRLYADAKPNPEAVGLHEFAYLALCYSCDESTFRLLLKGDATTAQQMASLVHPFVGNHRSALGEIWATLMCMSDRERFSFKEKAPNSSSDAYVDQVMSWAQVDRRTPIDSPDHPFREAAMFLSKHLTARRRLT